MNNKKILLTFLLAGILALAAALIYFRMSEKKEFIPVEEPQNIIETQMISTEEIVPDENSEQLTKKTTTIKKISHKKIQTLPRKHQDEIIKPAINTQIIVNEVPVNEVKTEEPTEEQGIIIPIEYKSKNTYKYIYTPNKF